MEWYAPVTRIALAAGMILLSAGCSGRKDVAIANKDQQIREKDNLIALERDEKEKLHAANEALARQNEEMATKNAQIAAQNTAETAKLRDEISNLQKVMQGIDLKMVALKPKEGLAEGQDKGYAVHPDGSIHIIVASTVLFDSGKADLKTSANPTLEKVAATLKKDFPNNFVRIEGHTDATPVVRNKDKFKDNMDLSIARSRAVYDFMIKQGGITANKLYTAGYGEFQPIVHPEKTVADRGKNRRVEIVIMPDNIKVQKEQLAAAPKPASAPIKKK